MKSLISAMLLLGSASLFEAQTIVQPGTMANAIAPPITIAAVPQDRDKAANRVWLASAFAFGAASAFDVASSWGKREENPLLASSNGDFGAKGLALKAGFTAALIVPQIWLRKRKEYRTKLAIINFADAAFFTGVAIHNLTVAPPSQSPSQP